jgi:hypothetical protein
MQPIQSQLGGIDDRPDDNVVHRFSCAVDWCPEYRQNLMVGDVKSRDA